MSAHELGVLLKDTAAWIVIYAVVIGLPAWIVISGLARWLT